jgi:transaldolase/glucose-6-phosphate isomerase
MTAAPELTGSLAARQTLSLPDQLQSRVDAALADWEASDKCGRLWRRDSSLWTGADEAEWLGWLEIADRQLGNPEQLERLVRDLRDDGFTHVLVLGMGGSSLAPEVLALTLGHADTSPELLVLDSTDPAQVEAFDERVDLERTLFIVSSKSGTTLEPNIFKEYFFARVSRALGAEEVARRFIAITDSGSQLEQAARRDGFRDIVHGSNSIGGRYSALSSFGIVPGAVAGVDVQALLERAREMAQACGPLVPARDNPGVVLGAVIGAAHNAGRDKLTIVASPKIRDLGAWLEQLLAESTGKQGKGVIPVDREPLATPDGYGEDRLFAYLRLASEPDVGQDRAIDAIARAGHPVVRIDVAAPDDLGGQFFQWEFATAVAGAVIGINPFDQPDVEASKIATRGLTSEYEETGSLPREEPFFEGDGVSLYGAPPQSGDQTLQGYLGAHLARLGEGDYCALLAYLQMNGERERALTEMRRLVRDRRRVATCVGFGPRYLHSTGQVHKGGPNSGVFLLITCDDPLDLEIPGRRYSFGVVKAAQARGDFDVLAERGRRALRVHLGTDIAAGLKTLWATIEEVI